MTSPEKRPIFAALVDELHIHPAEFGHALRMFVRWLLLGSGVGLLAGSASALFLASLQGATTLRLGAPGLLFLLPAGGFGVGWIYYRFAGAAARGNNLVIDEVHETREPIPARMAPLVLFGTLVTHLFGGSAGREGTAVQMGASLADWLHRRLRLREADRRLMLLAGISGGFGSVFGTPVAGFVFALEVQSIGRIGYEGYIPCFVASIVGDLVTRAWAITHAHYPHLAAIEIEPLLLVKVILAGVIFGLTSLLFVELTHALKATARKRIRYSPLRPVIGGVLVILMTLLVGTQDYLGLSLPLIQASVNGSGVAPFAFLGKLVFTAVTLGMGFMGGEVTPLFVIGSTLGFSLGRLLGVDPALMASIGFIAVFAGASNTPLACSLMGIELFGGGSLLYLAVGAFVASLVSGHRSIYSTQRIGIPKAHGSDAQAGESLEALQQRRAAHRAHIPRV